MGSEMVVLTGDASLGRLGITLKAMMKTLQKEGQGFLIEFNHLGAMKWTRYRGWKEYLGFWQQ